MKSPNQTERSTKGPTMINFTDTLKSITDDQAPLTIPVGVTKDDILKVLDLAKSPQILYAGATGSGNSVGLTAGIATLMSRNDPSTLRLTLIDPKRVELADYRTSAFVDAVITDIDRKSTRLNSSHVSNSYAVFCLKKTNQDYLCN